MSRQHYTIDQVLEELEDSDGVESKADSQLFRNVNLSSDSSSSESEIDQELDKQPQ